LNENPTGIILTRDELIGLLSSWERSGRESDRAFFLESWNGNGSHTTDRISRGTTFTENLCLSICGGIQPSKLKGYLNQAINSLGNDGLLQRFQMSVFPDPVKDWVNIDQYPNQIARQRAFSIISKLAETVDYSVYGAESNEFDRFPFLHFSSGAQAVFNEWLTDLQLKKLPGAGETILGEHLAKYRSLMPSLALIFHVIQVVDGKASGPVSVEAATMAAAWVDFLELHARRIYGLVDDSNNESLLKLAEKIKEGCLPNPFSVRDVYRKHWEGLSDPEICEIACDELRDLNWLAVKQNDQEYGRPKSREFVINPKVYDKN
jgi:hypothetical protein